MKIVKMYDFRLKNIGESIKNKFIRFRKFIGLNADVFQKQGNNKVDNSKLRHIGDDFKHIPDSVATETTLEGISISKIKFYPEDLKKMEKMSVEECLNYKKYLIEQDRFIL